MPCSNGRVYTLLSLLTFQHVGKWCVCVCYILCFCAWMSMTTPHSASSKFKPIRSCQFSPMRATVKSKWAKRFLPVSVVFQQIKCNIFHYATNGIIALSQFSVWSFILEFHNQQVIEAIDDNPQLAMYCPSGASRPTENVSFVNKTLKKCLSESCLYWNLIMGGTILSKKKCLHASWKSKILHWLWIWSAVWWWTVAALCQDSLLKLSANVVLEHQTPAILYTVVLIEVCFPYVFDHILIFKSLVIIVMVCHSR